MIYCTCGNCRKYIFQPDPIVPSVPDTSDLVMHFCNQVVEKLNAEYPHVRLCTYVYANFQVGPQKVRVNPHVIGMFAPLSFGRYHYTGDPRSASRTLLAQAVDRFAASAGQFGWYDYSFLCPDAMMPFTRVHMVSHDLPYLYDKGLRYWTIETARNWPNYTPDYYLTAKLTWDVRLDQKQLLDEFYASYFGPAGGSLRTYIDELVEAYSSLAFSAGNKEFMGAVFTAERLKKLRGLMNQAMAAARRTPTLAHRVKLFDLTLQQGERFMAMREATNRCDFQQAQRINDEILRGFGDAMAFDRLDGLRVRPRLLVRRLLRQQRETGRIVDEGCRDPLPLSRRVAHRAASQGGGRAVGLSAEAENVLRLPRRARPRDVPRGDLAQADVPHPDGAARQEALPAVRGFDDTLTAWVDGKEIGKAASGSFGPALLEISGLDAAKPEHTLVVRVTNKGVSELGTGGIIRPVCLIARDPLPH